MARILCTIVLLCFALCTAENTEIKQGIENLKLQQDPLSWLDKLQDEQAAMKKQSILDLFYKLFKSENGIILQEPKDKENQEMNRRGAGRRLTTQTRRVVCRVFFWKSWAAC